MAPRWLHTIVSVLENDFGIDGSTAQYLLHRSAQVRRVGRTASVFRGTTHDALSAG
jgi:hypothetical protein